MIYEKPENVKAPWYKFYGGMRQHLDYPTCSLFNFMRERNLDRYNYTAYNYFGKQVNYRTFIDQIDEAARAFRAYGINEGDAVTICMPNTPEAVISFYALNKIGAIANMIHPLSAENEIHYYFEISESRLVVAINVSVEKVLNVIKDTKIEKVILVSPADSMPMGLKVGYTLTQGRKVHVPKSDMIIKWADFLKIGEGKENFNANQSGDATAAILYSGGTTGYPKGIVLSNRALMPAHWAELKHVSVWNRKMSS